MTEPTDFPNEPDAVVEPGPDQEQDVPAPDAEGDVTDIDPNDAANE